MASDLYPHTERVGHEYHLCCTMCGKRVSTAFWPLTHALGVELVVRAIIVCPECINSKLTFKEEPVARADDL